MITSHTITGDHITHSISCDHITHSIIMWSYHTHSTSWSHLNHDHIHWCWGILCDWRPLCILHLLSRGGWSRYWIIIEGTFLMTSVCIVLLVRKYVLLTQRVELGWSGRVLRDWRSAVHVIIWPTSSVCSVVYVILTSGLFFHYHQVAGSVVWAGPVKTLHQWCSRMWLLEWEGKRWFADSPIAVHTTSLGPVCCRESQTALLWVMIYQILNWFGQHLRISLITILSQTLLFR